VTRIVLGPPQEVVQPAWQWAVRLSSPHLTYRRNLRTGRGVFGMQMDDSA
jgi:hypothetical protein